jgi:hypothetical protein
MISKRYVTAFGLVLGLFAMFASQARANTLTAAPATADCSGFSLSVTISDLAIGTMYEVDFQFFLTPVSTGITEPPVTGMIKFTATSTTQTVTATGSWPGSPLSEPTTVSGQVTLTATGSSLGITFNGTDSQLLLLGCSPAGGCPATIGFWKNAAKHPFPTSVKTNGLTIGGVTYTAAQLLTILKATGSGNAVAILGKQLVGALINLAAGAAHNATADAAIADAETLLQNNSLNLLTSNVGAGTTLGQELLADEVTLDAYNNANFGTCTEGSGLTF